MRAVPSARPLPSRPLRATVPTVRLRRALRLGRRRYTPPPMQAKSRLSIVGAVMLADLGYRKNVWLSWANAKNMLTWPHMRGRRYIAIAHMAIIDRFVTIESDIRGYAYILDTFARDKAWPSGAAGVWAVQFFILARQRRSGPRSRDPCLSEHRDQGDSRLVGSAPAPPGRPASAKHDTMRDSNSSG